MKEELKKNPDLLKRKWSWDLQLIPEDVTINFAQDLLMFEPSGKGNEKPTFAVDGKIANLKTIGNEAQYRRFQLISEKSGLFVPCVCFGIEEGSIDELSEGGYVRTLGNISVNRWNGNISPQMNVKKIFQKDTSE